jgi:type II secretory pathway pseudopilin PulG
VGEAAAAATKKGNGLPITAVVLSALFFLPIVPLVGLVLGIVALTTGRSKAISIVAICLGAFFTLMMGVYAAIAIPAFMKYIERAKEAEARSNLSIMATEAASLTEDRASGLPDAAWTPAGSACAQPDHKFPVEPEVWQREPWRTFGFHIDRPHYFQYRATRVSGGFHFEARADLRCNGHFTELSRDPM